MDLVQITMWRRRKLKGNFERHSSRCTHDDADSGSSSQLQAKRTPSKNTDVTPKFMSCSIRICAHVIIVTHTHAHVRARAAAILNTPLCVHELTSPAHLLLSHGNTHSNMLQLVFMANMRLLFNCCWNLSFDCLGVL